MAKANGIGKDAAILTVAKVAAMAVSTATAMMLARFRTLSEYGTFSQLILVINLAIALFMLGLPNSTNYFLARYETHEEKRHFLSVYYTLSTLLSLICGAVLTAAVPLEIAYFDNPAIESFAYVLAILPWTMVITSSISHVLVVYRKTKLLTLYNVLSGMVILLAVVFVQLVGWSFKEYMILYVAANSMIAVSVYAIVWRLEGGLYFSIDGSLIKKIFAFSIPIGLASLVGTLTLEIDKLVVARLFDTETLAVYTNAARELPFTIISSSLSAVLLPQAVRKIKNGEEKAAVALWGRSVELSYILMAFIVMALVVFAPQLITILYSEKYLAGVGVFRVYSLILILRVTYFGMMLSAKGATKTILYSSVLTLAANGILDILLYYLFGILGPAIATGLSVLVSVSTQLIRTTGILKIKLAKIFPWKQLLRHTILNVVLGALGYAVIQFLGLGVSVGEIFACIGIGIVLLGVYFVIEFGRIKELWKELNREQ